MRSIISKAIFTVFMLAAFGSYAQTQTTTTTTMVVEDNSMFENSTAMMEHLRTTGIEPSAVNWGQIDPLCASLLRKGQVPFNKCKFEKANASFTFERDRKQCFAASEAEFPDILRQRSTTETFIKTDENGEQVTYERVVEPISRRNLNKLRYSSMVKCMQDIGWIDAEDYRAGIR